MPGMDEIVPRTIFLSDLGAANNKELMESKGIRSVLSIGVEPSTKLLNVKYYSFPDILDTPESKLLQIFPATNEIIGEAVKKSTPLLVHCVYGQSRSVATIASYLMHSCNESLESALALINSKRPGISINPGFVAQLVYMESLYRERNAMYELLVYSAQYAQASKNGDDLQRGARKYDPPSTSVIECASCGHILCHSREDVVLPEHDRDPTSVIEAVVDDFWKGYRPLFTTKAKKKIAPSDLYTAECLASGNEGKKRKIKVTRDGALALREENRKEPRRSEHNIKFCERSAAIGSSMAFRDGGGDCGMDISEARIMTIRELSAAFNCILTRPLDWQIRQLLSAFGDKSNQSPSTQLPAISAGHLHPAKQRRPDNEEKVIRGVASMSMASLTSSYKLLHCPNPECAQICGFWKRDACIVLSGYFVCDAFALSASSVKVKPVNR